MLRRIYIIALVSLLFTVVACSNRDYYRIDIDRVAPVDIFRFDSLVYEFCQLDATDTIRQYEITSRAGDFWKIYTRHIIAMDTFDAPLFQQGVTRFYHKFNDTGIFDKALRTYADDTDEAHKLAQVSARYLTLFPRHNQPQFQFHLSGLSQQSIVTLDSLVSISTDCYIDSCTWYRERYYEYELPMHTRERIIPDVSEVLLRNAILPVKVATLLDAMIYEGRIAYLVSCLIDNNSTTAVMGYTTQQENWCVENEHLVWTTIIEQGDLYKSDNITIRKYIQPSPFTATLTQDSPGRIGRWIGWRIVDEYARKQGLSPHDIATDTTLAIEVLQLSGYDGK